MMDFQSAKLVREASGTYPQVYIVDLKFDALDGKMMQIIVVIMVQ
jgi:hypothetical protein